MKSIYLIIVSAGLLSHILYPSELIPQSTRIQPGLVPVPREITDLKANANAAMKKGHIADFKRILAHPLFAHYPQAHEDLAGNILFDWTKLKKGKPLLISCMDSLAKHNIPFNFSEDLVGVFEHLLISKNLKEFNIRAGRFKNLFELLKSRFDDAEIILQGEVLQIAKRINIIGTTAFLSDTNHQEHVLRTLFKSVALTDEQLHCVGIVFKPLTNETEEKLHAAESHIIAHEPTAFMQLMSTYPFLATRRSHTSSSLIDTAMLHHLQTEDRFFYIQALLQRKARPTEESLERAAGIPFNLIELDDTKRALACINALAKLCHLFKSASLHNYDVLQNAARKKLFFDPDKPERARLIQRLCAAIERY